MIGLKLKQKNEEFPFKAFNYTPIIQYPPDLPPTDWHLLSLYEVDRDHIRIHELRDGDNLLSCVGSYKNCHAKAVIVVNSNEDTTLPPDISQLFIHMTDFLVAVLPFSKGSSLIDILQIQFRDKELFTKLDIISTETTYLTSLSEHYDRGISLRLGRIFGDNHSVFDLKSEVKKIMFDSNNHLKCITSDAGLFSMIMATFSQYERIGKVNSFHVNKLIRRFQRYLKQVFEYEFPFWLILAYRLKKFHQFYEREGLASFIKRCIEMFEVLPPHQVSKILLGFLEKKDFDVMFGPEETNVSVFALLATAAIDLMSLSMNVKSARPAVIANTRIIYCRILWISVYLKIVSLKGNTRSDLAIWDRHFIQKISKKNPVTQEMINDFKHGLELSTLLQLSIDCQFTVHYLSRFIADEKLIRPFAHARSIVTGLAEFIQSDKELVQILINLRAFYTGHLRSSDPKVIGVASVDGTLQSTIDEGISFLDSINELWSAKGWSTGDQHEDFRKECLEWILLLLGTIKMTNPSAHIPLKKFMAPRRDSIVADRDYRCLIIDHTLQETRKAFPDLSIQQFYLLYRNYRIWPVPFLHDYLKQCHIPNIVDPIWSELFTEVLSRHSSADNVQNIILDFIIKVADEYRKAQCSRNFIPDIFQLNVPNLFSSSNEPEENNAVVSIEDRFTDFIQDYIQQNYDSFIMERMQDILSKSDTEKWSTIHFLMLKILQQESQNVTTDISKQFIIDLVNISVTSIYLSFHSSWLQHALSPHEMFYWGIISTTCSKIPICIESIGCVVTGQPLVISLLGVVFNAYCDLRKLSGQDCLLTGLPGEVAKCQYKDVQDYFRWILQVQTCLCSWQDRALRNDLNFDEILMYASNSVSINILVKAANASDYVMDLQDMQIVKESFMTFFEQLNFYLIKYIQNCPELEYCNLVELLLSYGVHFPTSLQQKLQNKVILPGHDIPAEQKLKNVISVSSQAGLFEPGQEAALTVTRYFTLYDLQRLLEDIQTFLEPIQDYMEMLVFFHLQKSKIFSKHLDAAIAMEAAHPLKTDSPSTGTSSLIDSSNHTITKVIETREVPILVLQKALSIVKKLILEIVKGTATYSDVIGGGNLNLQTLIDTDEEVQKLRQFSKQLEVNDVDCVGLEGLQSVSDLVQFDYIYQSIMETCQQCGLVKCLEDEVLLKVKLEISQPLVDITLIEASERMASIKKTLCIEDHYSCLQVFPVIAKSASLCQFVMNMQLTGHDLVTTQIQDVTSQLNTFFEIIALFKDTNISFLNLIKELKEFTASSTGGLKKLKTVEKNIMRIKMMLQLMSGQDHEDIDTNSSTEIADFDKFFKATEELWKMYEERHDQQERELINFKEQQQGMLEEIQALTEELKQERKHNFKVQQEYQEEKEKHTKALAEFQKLQEKLDLEKRTHEKEIEDLGNAHQQEKKLIERENEHVMLQIQCIAEELETKREHVTEVQQEYQEEKEKHTKAMAGFQKLQEEFELEKRTHEKEVEDLQNAHQQEKKLLEEDKAHMMVQIKSFAEELETKRNHVMETQQEYQEEKVKHARTMARFQKLQEEIELEKRTREKEIEDLQNAHQQQKKLLEEDKAHMMVQIKSFAEELETKRNHVMETQQEYQEEKVKHARTMARFQKLQEEIELEKRTHEKEVEDLQNAHQQEKKLLEEDKAHMMVQIKSFAEELETKRNHVMETQQEYQEEKVKHARTMARFQKLQEEIELEKRTREKEIEDLQNAHQQQKKLLEEDKARTMLQTECLAEELETKRNRVAEVQLEYQEEKDKHTKTMNCFWKLQGEYEVIKAKCAREIKELQKDHQQEKVFLNEKHAKSALQIQYLADELEEKRRNIIEVQQEYQKEKEKHMEATAEFQKLQKEFELEKGAHEKEIQDLRNDYQQEKKLLEEDKAHLTFQTQCLAEELETERQHVTEVQQEYQEEKEKHMETMAGFRNLQEEYEIDKTSHEKEIQEMEEKNTRVVLALQEIIKQFEQSWRIKNKDITLISQKLGKGAWGSVEVGVYQEEKVAVKQLHNLIVSEDTLAVMNREINTMSRLRHPHLLLFIGAVLDHPSGNPLLITEIMDTSLRQAYKKGQLTNDDTSKLSILRDTASGLNYLHCHHDEIIHRDVSSANVLLESKGTKKWRAKISDFGSANIARESTTPAAGAQVYSAPETLTAITDETSYPQTTKMDVYSYGILTCEVMCCRFPEREQFQSMLRSVGRTSPILIRLINDCTAKNPLERPSMAQVIQQLARIMAQDKT